MLTSILKREEDILKKAEFKNYQNREVFLVIKYLLHEQQLMSEQFLFLLLNNEKLFI